MEATKANLRRQLKQARLELTDAERTVMSRAIVEHLKQAIDWSAISTLHYFEPIKQQMEPDIDDLITYLEDTYPDLKLFTPRLIGEKWELIAVKGGEMPDEFDVVLVPMLGFDTKLNRIGYGGGYYDKFLANQPHAKKIGVCYEQGRVESIPTEPHDIALDLVVTDSLIYP